MELIRRQVEKSLADPELRNLAVRIVSRTYDQIDTPQGRKSVVLGWGKQFWAPEGPPCPAKDDSCELGDIWAFVVRNCRYVYDPDGTDLFATAKVTLLSGGGDCDDATVTICALARAIGFTDTRARVVSMGGEEWEHVYPVIGCPKDNPQVLIPFDCTVAGVAAGWQVPGARATQDFPMF